MKAFLSTHVVVGGLSTKQLYNQIINWNTKNPIDIVTGDGEWIMLDIVKNSVQDIPFINENGRRVFKVDQNSRYIVNDLSLVSLDRSFF